MKRLFLILLSLLLLWGCAANPEPTAPTEPSVPMVTEAPTEPAGLYDPDSAMEAATNGALKLYPLNKGDTQSVVPFGTDLLLFNTYDVTTLTRLSGGTLYPTASVTLDCAVYGEDPAVRVSEKGVTYYDMLREDLVFLDIHLKEVNRVQLPEGIQGVPALSEDRKTLYYFTAEALRALDLESGIDRLVKEMYFFSQSIVGLHCGDTILECSVGDEWGNWYQMYLSVATGELLYEVMDYVTLYTEGDRYFATHLDGAYPEKLTGVAGGDARVLLSPDYEAEAFPVLERDAVITVTASEAGTTLDYYQLSDGTRPYSLTLPADIFPWSFVADPMEDCIWFLWYDEALGGDVLCRWELEKSAVEDDTVYIGIRRTMENPDTDGLEKCAERAAELSEKHDVQILTWTDAAEIQPWDYTFVPEYQVDVLRAALEELDAALSNFPEGFLEEATSEMGDGVLRISLVRSILGVADTGSLDTAAGVQFWDDDANAYVCLQIVEGMEQNLYHELFHVAESRIFSLSAALDNWEDLNPEGFKYDNEYTSYGSRDDYSLIEGETRAFIDFYSMTYPKEDRARIMEYAMMPGNGNWFASETMQSKLKAICTGIREAYGLEETQQSFLWEQYLNEPLYIKK